MKILITGSQGYIGNPLTKTLKEEGHDIYAIDNGMRVDWVKEVGGKSLTNYDEEDAFFRDLRKFESVKSTLKHFKPEIIIHLASQPSGPYSEISSEHRAFTQLNNVTMLENILNSSHELQLDPYLIVTTTTGIPGAPDKPILEDYMPNAAGSEYHMTRGWDSDNIRLAVRQKQISRVLELRTSIVYGTRIDDFDEPVTRFDWDFWFGTALNRFCLMKKMGEPITIYGKGLQKKPFISLRNCVKSIRNAIFEDIEGHVIMNQTTGPIAIVDLANAVGGEVKHIPNPRIENESHQMVINNDKFLTLLESAEEDLNKEVEFILNDIETDRLPKNWKDVYGGNLRK